MALNINEYNATFKAFTDFATERVEAGNGRTIAKIDGSGSFGDRMIVAKSGDLIGNVGRRSASRNVNDAVRNLFRETVAGMCGGEAKIPQSVKDAMRLQDFDKGKPLTARRIIAVKAAIDAEVITIQDAFLTGDYEGQMADLAKAKGHTEGDFEKLNLGANLLAKASGKSLKSALLEVMDKSSAAYACVKLGPLYTGCVGDFKKGLEMQGEFKGLQAEMVEFINKAASGEDVKAYAGIAEKRIEQLNIAKQQANCLFAMQTVLDKSCNAYTELMTEIDNAIQDLKDTAKGVNNGSIKDEEGLYKRTVESKEMINKICSAFCNKLAALVWRNKNKGDAGQMTAISLALRELNSICISGPQDGGIKAFSAAFAKKNAAVIKAMFLDAEKTGGFKLPTQFYDSIESNLKTNNFNGVKAFSAMARAFKVDCSSVLFNESQKSRLKTIIAKQAGEATASHLIDKFVDEMESACCQGAFRSACKGEKWRTTQIEDLVNHFEVHPGLAKGFVIGFKEDRMDEVKSDLERVIAENFNTAMNPTAKDFTSLKSGMMPQSIREYNKGYVTFNGTNISDGVTRKQFSAADTDYRRGYCEFLESKFDDNHVQMRRFVSFACGMADGLGGVICTGAFSGVGMSNNPDLVKSPPRSNEYYKKEGGGSELVAKRDARENYDIRIDETTGDVTIQLTHYETTSLSSCNYMSSDGTSKTPVSFAKADMRAPDMAKTRIDVTMVVKNASDIELNGKMPEFKITEIKQQVV